MGRRLFEMRRALIKPEIIICWRFQAVRENNRWDKIVVELFEVWKRLWGR